VNLLVLTRVLINARIIKVPYGAPTSALQILTTSKGGVKPQPRILSLKPLTLHRMKSVRKVFLVTQQEGSRRSLSFKYRFKNFVMPVSQCRRPNKRHNVHFEGPTAFGAWSMSERQMEREKSGSLLGVRVCAGTEQCCLAWAFEKATSIHMC
jgi:hypothetical protein